jgi:hypothetical protein
MPPVKPRVDLKSSDSSPDWPPIIEGSLHERGAEEHAVNADSRGKNATERNDGDPGKERGTEKGVPIFSHHETDIETVVHFQHLGYQEKK